MLVLIVATYDNITVNINLFVGAVLSERGSPRTSQQPQQILKHVNTMELRVSFRGKTLLVEVLEGTIPLSSLKEKLEELTAVPTANQKLVSSLLRRFAS